MSRGKKRRSGAPDSKARRKRRETGRPVPAQLPQDLARGLALHQRGQLEEARTLFERAVRARPRDGTALHLLGLLQFQTGETDRAIASLEGALRHIGNDIACLNTLGAALHKQRRYGEAVKHYTRSLEADPTYADALENRGRAFLALHAYHEAQEDFQAYLGMRPQAPSAWCHYGVALGALGQDERALQAFERATQLNPAYARAFYERANLLADRDRYAEAIVAYDRAQGLKPDQAYLAGLSLHARMKLCDWRDFPARRAALRAAILDGRRACHPGIALSVLDDPEVHRAAADLYSSTFASRQESVPRRRLTGRLRIGYFSSDFHDHATTRLIVEMIESHDRDAVEVIGFSFGERSDAPLGQRIGNAFDAFHDVRTLGDDEVVAKARGMNLDIAIDLKGNTAGARPRLFALRCAPLQVAYLGYPGTFSATAIDYALADDVVIPRGAEAHFSERVIRLPRCYQPNDSQRPRPDRSQDRAAHGLPGDAVVYCSMNSPYKTLPEVFDIWMRILLAVEGSVLWLLEGSPGTRDNLCREAQQRGVDSERLVFAPYAPPAEHLKRYVNADVFLDTWPYNGHTTASDALWAGLPIVTRAGRSFASRVAASLLTTLSVPELITSSAEAYEALAISLGTDRTRREGLRERILTARDASPLFCGADIARHVETAFHAIAQRYNDGLPPGDVEVFAQGDVAWSEARAGYRPGAAELGTSRDQDL